MQKISQQPAKNQHQTKKHTHTQTNKNNNNNQTKNNNNKKRPEEKRRRRRIINLRVAFRYLKSDILFFHTSRYSTYNSGYRSPDNSNYNYFPRSQGRRRFELLSTNIPMPVASSPPPYPRDFSDHRVPLKDDSSKDYRYIRRGLVDCETTSDGNVVVTERSYDTEENYNDSYGKLSSDERGTSYEDDSMSRDGPSPPRKHRRGRHTRDLSAHFFDATRLTDDSKGHGEMKHDDRSSVGQKHRRVFSGDVSNPPLAHRRINSRGGSAAIERGHYGQRHHQRVDSAGLDMLTAVAGDISREELEAAAGPPSEDRKSPWEPPSSAPRRSPIEMSSYDYSAGIMPTRSHHRSSYPPSRHVQGYVTTAVGTHLAPPPPYGHAPSYTSHYYAPPPSHLMTFPRAPPPLPSSGAGGATYPVQYSNRSDPYAKQQMMPPPPHGLHPPVHHETSHASPHATTEKSPVPRERSMSGSNNIAIASPPLSSGQWRGGSGPGAQTYLTSISGVGDGARAMPPSSHHHRATSSVDFTDPAAFFSGGHHRKLSSFSSLGPLSSIFQSSGDVGDHHPLKGHHRSTSSSVSFLQAFDVGFDPDSSFLGGLDDPSGVGLSAPTQPAAAEAAPAPAPTSTQSIEVVKKKEEVVTPPATDRTNSPPKLRTPSPPAGKDECKVKLASGGASKRVRRKCTVADCPNRVVQGGLCISHGAKRKTCNHPGCTKNVKKAGMCSTHGPARKRCEAEGCGKVAVQGGRCIAHGAKKKLCSVEECEKQAILGGMCKKHHDLKRKQETETTNPQLPLVDASQCHPIDSNDIHKSPPSGRSLHKPTHTRGLSIFQDLSTDEVGKLLSVGPVETSGPPPPSHRRHGYSREYGMY